MQNFQLLDIMSKSYYKGMKEIDSVVAVALWKCRITGCFMELWVTLFAGRGKAVLCFSCPVNRVIHNGIASYAHFHDVC